MKSKLALTVSIILLFFSLLMCIMVVFPTYLPGYKVQPDPDCRVLINYCLTNNYRTNKIDFAEIVKQVRKAAGIYNFDRYIIYAIMMQESQCQQYATHVNWNNTIDYGFMQINSLWCGRQYIAEIQPLTDNIIFDVRVNIQFGTWLFFEDLKSNNGDLVGALQEYNSCPDLTYSRRVIKIYTELNRTAR